MPYARRIRSPRGQALLACLLACAPVAAAPPPEGAAATACVVDAARHHGVNPWVLAAVLHVESRFRPDAMHRNANRTWDLGMAQINSIHWPELARHGIAPAHLMDACVATYVGAWHLARQVRRHGNTWFGIAAYHSVSPCPNARYARLLWNTLRQWGIVAGPAQPPAPSACATPLKVPR